MSRVPFRRGGPAEVGAGGGKKKSTKNRKKMEYKKRRNGIHERKEVEKKDFLLQKQK